MPTASFFRSGRLHVVAVSALAAFAASLVAACAPDSSTTGPGTDASQLYWALTLDHRAVTLSTAAPYDTLQLTATPRLSSGAAMPDAPPPRFTSTDLERVQVDATGLLRAVGVGTGIVVVAADTVGNIVHADTVLVNVTDVAAPPRLAALSIHPVPPDSSRFALGGTLFVPQKVLAARTLDTAGAAIDGLAVHYASSDRRIAIIDRFGVVTPIRPGEVTFYATTTAYGVTQADTLPFTIGLPLLVTIEVRLQTTPAGDTTVLLPPATVLGVGGDILWDNPTAVPVDVTFDDPSTIVQDDVLCSFLGALAPEAFCTGGDIAPFAIDTSGPFLSTRVRRFPVPGTYHYQSPLHGTTGTIVVQ
jgi:hypothetical protein